MIRKRDIKDVIDSYLDLYNDYSALYKMFGDEIYLFHLTTIESNLKKLSRV